MKTRELNILCRFVARKVLYIALIVSLIVNSGCDVFGLLASPGVFEKKTAPEYNLLAQQDRKILLWVECPHSSGADYDVKDKLTAAYLLYLTETIRIPSENIFLHQPAAENNLVQDPMRIARDLGAGYVLLIQVYDYEMLPLSEKKYYSGEMVTRAVLMDTDLGISVWPRDPSGKIIRVGVDVETKGRNATLNRLVSATVHCTLRYLYPCEKLKFKTIDEKISIQDTFEM